MKETIQVTGMHCKSCKALIEDVLSEESVGVKFNGNTAEIEYDENSIGMTKIIKLIEENGYGVSR